MRLQWYVKPDKLRAVPIQTTTQKGKTVTEQTTTETTEQSDNQQPTAPPVEIPAAYQQMVDLNKQMLTGWATQANALVRAVKASENVETTIQDTIDTADDAEVKQYREWLEEQEAVIERAYQAVREYVKANLLPSDNDAVDPEKALAEWKELRDSYDGLTKVMAKFPGFDADIVKAVLSDVPAIENMGRNRGGKSGASGIRRPRVTRIRYRVVGTEEWTESFTAKVKDGVEERTVGFTPLGQNLRKTFGKVDDGNLRMQADEAAGTTEWASLEGKPFTFVVSIPSKADENKSVHVEIEVTPKQSKSEDDQTEAATE